MGSVLFGTSGTARSYAPEGATSLSVAGVRLLLGAVPLVIFALWRRARPIPRPGALSFVAGASMTAFQILFFAAVQRQGVAIGTMLAIGSSPIMTSIAELARGERPHPRTIIGTVGALGGLALLVLGQPHTQQSINAIGVACGLGAGACYALYTILSKQLLHKGWSTTWTMTWSFVIAGALSIPIVLLEPTHWLTTPRGVTVALYLGIATIAVSYLLYSISLRRLASSTVVTLTLVEPVTASLLGVAILHEQLSVTSWCGAGVILLGLVLVGRNAPEPA